MQPGELMTPDSQSGNPSENNQPQPPSTLVTPGPSNATPEEPAQASWAYREEAGGSEHSLDPIGWTASEYIDHEKRAGWFLAVAGIALLTAAFIYLLTRDAINSIVILVVAALFAVSGARRPQILAYGLDSQGIHIGNKFYPYDQLRSFAVMQEDAFHSIQIFQFKRFTTPITLYFPPDQEERIINFLGSYLPHEVRTHDPIDRLMRRVRF